MQATKHATRLIGALLCLFSYASMGGEATHLDFGNYVGRIYSDGSGNIGKQSDVENFKDTWSFRIKTDEMTDEKVITVNRYAYKNSKEFGALKLDHEIWLWINFSKEGRETLCIAGHDFPGKNGMIRIDKNDPITTSENGCVPLSRNLDAQLKKGEQITLRGYHWPYEGGETKKISLGGYVVVSEFLRTKR
ncbi:hypothetical protein ABGV17_01630 [Guyparkeria sp. GHLCS8-2]|uniref:hypothetical protein n=1 Tax=Guyparkeria halopsychrophila TaxID=3139421 RepID=UPI0037C6F4F3